MKTTVMLSLPTHTSTAAAGPSKTAAADASGVGHYWLHCDNANITVVLSVINTTGAREQCDQPQPQVAIAAVVAANSIPGLTMEPSKQ